MSRLQELLDEMCPNGVEYKTFVEKKKQPDDALLGFDKFNFDKED